MKALQDLHILVHAVDSGSLSAAARALDITPAAASAALKRLELELGAQLLVRSTRSLRLTPQGDAFLARARPALEELRHAQVQLASGEDIWKGVLRLAAPSDFGRNVLMPWLELFQTKHPGVALRLQLSDRMANVYADPVDAAVRYGKPQDSSLVALPLVPDNRRVLCAAPSYLAQHGAPQTPHELTGRDCLCFMLGEDVHDRWRFTAAGGEPTTVRVRAVNVSNDGDAVRRWALQGRGIAYKSRLDVANDLIAGRLVPLCTDWRTEPTPLYLAVPDRRHITPRMHTLREFLGEQAQALWQRSL
jgi:DNA-binding transcriptional LysR family regulator